MRVRREDGSWETDSILLTDFLWGGVKAGAPGFPQKKWVGLGVKAGTQNPVTKFNENK